MKPSRPAIVLLLLAAPVSWLDASAPPVLTPGLTPALTPSATPPPASLQPSAARAPATDPTGFDAIRRQFGDLARWLGTRGVGSGERREIEAFQSRVQAFAAANPDQPAAQAILAQTAIWLGDTEAVDATFAHLLSMRPGNDAVLASWGRFWMGRNRFERVVEVIDAHLGDAARSPQSVALKAEGLIALHRFDEATAALDTIAVDTVGDPSAAAELARLRSAVEETAAAWIVEQELRAAEATRDDLPRIELVIERGSAGESPEASAGAAAERSPDGGTIVLELFEDSAPNTVANFIDLVGRGFYDGTAFHRVLPAFMAQGGDPNSRPGAVGQVGQGGPGHRIAGEATLEQARKHFSGSVAMAHNGDPDNAGSQFYMCFVPAPHLNGIHTVFGRVLEGEDLLLAMQQNDALKSARVLRKRDHEYVPVTLPPLPPPAPVPTGLPPGFSMPPGLQGGVQGGIPQQIPIQTR